MSPRGLKRGNRGFSESRTQALPTRRPGASSLNDSGPDLRRDVPEQAHEDDLFDVAALVQRTDFRDVLLDELGEGHAMRLV